MSLWRDDRAQSVGIMRLFLGLIVGAIVVFLVTRVTNPLFSRATDKATTATGSEAIGWFEAVVTYLPVAFVLISFFGILVLSIYKREVVGA